MSRLLRKLLITVAGMAPTAVKTCFVSAILNAGYHVELAGGGYYNASPKLVSSPWSTPEGKAVKVKGYIYRDGQAVIEVVSSFLYRGRFTNYENTFETTEEPDYLVPLETDSQVGVLQSEQWFGKTNQHFFSLAPLSFSVFIPANQSFSKRSYENYQRQKQRNR
jgi:fatty acid synthase subunit alpha